MSDSHDSRAPLARRLRPWLRFAGVCGLWLLPGTLLTGQYWFMYVAEQREVDGIALALWQIPAWLVFVPATYLVLWLGRRLAPSRERWLVPGLVHLAVATALALIHSLVHVVVSKAVGPEAWRAFPFGGMLFGIFLARYHIALMIHGGILGIAMALDFQRKFRERELLASRLQAQLAQAQLQALKMQLHPHFLFNTLNAISVSVRKGANDQAVRMLAGLSDLLRIALENSGTQEVSLRQELDFLERYLALQQIRFRDRLQVHLEVAPETLDARVPNLILQPLVENAIRHGISRDSAAGRIEIRSRCENGSLRVEVLDDGPGFDDRAEPLEGVGIRNTRQRLSQLYGDGGRLTLANGGGRGARVVLEIPYRPVAP